MRKTYTQGIDEVVKAYLKAYKIDKKILEVRTVGKWEEIIGRKVAMATSNIYVNKQILFVYISSPVMKQELLMIKEGIIKRFNELAGEQIITDIIFR